MNRLFTIVFLFTFFGAKVTFSQVSIGTTTPDVSAILEIYSSKKGVLFSRMTQSERNKIVKPIESLLIYQTDGEDGFYYYTGTQQWEKLSLEGKQVTSMSTDPTSGELSIYYLDGSVERHLTLKGPKGDRGEAFEVNYRGQTTDRLLYNSEPEGTSFFDIEKGLLYFRISGGWTAGVPFGKGVPGVVGDTGDTGTKGYKGRKGEQGDQGPRGYQGYPFHPSKIGLEADRYKYATSSQWFSYFSTDKGLLYFLESTGNWTSGIPFGLGGKGDQGAQGDQGVQGEKGEKGEDGQSFKSPESGFYVDRSTHDSELSGYSFFALDSGLLYFRVGTTPGNWSKGVPYGKGARGGTFSINQYGVYADQSKHDSELEGYTYYALDHHKVYFKQKIGWSSGVPMARLSGDPFEVDREGVYADLGAYSLEKQGFTYYATDTGKIYFRKESPGWTEGTRYLEKGRSFVIDVSAPFSSRALYSDKPEGFVFYAADRREVYFKGAGTGNWSRRYRYGIDFSGSPPANVLIVDDVSLPQLFSITGDFSLSDIGEVDINPGAVELRHLKPLTGVGIKHGTLYLWNQTRKVWEKKAIEDLYTYNLFDSLGLYYDALNNRLGKGTKTPEVGFDIAEYTKMEFIEVSELLDVRSTAVFNELAGDYDFRVESKSMDHMLYADASANSVGIGGVSSPTAMLDVGTDAVFNTSKSDKGDLRVSGSTEDNLLYVDVSQEHVGIGTATPDARFSVARNALLNQGGGTHDLQVKGSTEGNLLYVDGSADGIGIGTNSPTAGLDVRGAATFNEEAGDHDFRIDGVSASSLLHIDASENRVGIGTAIPQEKLGVAVQTVINQDLGSNTLQVRGQANSVLHIDAASERVGVGTESPKALLDVRGETVFNSQLRDFDVRIAGLARADLFYTDADQSRVGIKTIRPESTLDVRGGAVFNEEGEDLDFRVESQGFESMLFVDAGNNRVGIGANLPLYTLDVRGSATFNEDGEDSDFRVESTSMSGILFVDGGGGSVGLGTENPSDTLDVRGSVVFNEDGEDLDFRVEGDTDENLLFIDAGNNRVGIGTNAPNAILDVRGSAVFNQEGLANHDFRIESKDSMNMFFVDASESHLGLWTATPLAELDVRGAAVFNADKGDNDFRVDGSTTTHMIFVDANEDKVGIGTSVPLTTLDVVGSAIFNELGLKDDDFRVSGGTASHLLFVDAQRNAVSMSGLATATADTNAISTTEGATVFNEDGEDYDFRVDARTLTHAFFIDAGQDRIGMGTSTPQARLDVDGGSTHFNSKQNTNYDFRVDGDAITSMLYVDAGNNRVGIGTSSPVATLDVRGTALFNRDQDASQDFLVKADGFANMLFVDAGQNRIGVGLDAPQAMLHVRGSVTFNEDSEDRDFRVETDGNSRMLYIDGATSSVGIRHQASRTMTADFEVFGSATFNEGSANQDFRVGNQSSTTVFMVDASTNGVGIFDSSPLSNTFDVRASSVFNEAGADVDFRVESDNQTHMLFVDAGNDRVGIGTSSPTASLDVRGSTLFNSSKGDFDFRVESDGQRYMLFVDASTDRVGIGTNNPICRLHVKTNSSHPLTVRKATSGVAPGIIALGSYYYGGSSAGHIGLSSGKSIYWGRMDLSAPTASTPEIFNYGQAITHTSMGILVRGSLLIHGGSLVSIERGSATIISSDRRIKKSVLEMDGQKSLDKMSRVNLINYKMKDSLIEGKELMTGVLAQDVKKIDPSWVNYESKYIPNVYTSAKVISQGEKELLLEMPHTIAPDADLKVGDRLQLYVLQNIKKETAVFVNLLEIAHHGDNVLRLRVSLPEEPLWREADWQTFNSVFVYGKEVKDFHTVNYNKIFLANLQATQMLLKDRATYKTFKEEAEKKFDKLDRMKKKLKLLQKAVHQILLDKKNK